MNNPIISIHNLCVNYITSGKPIEAVNDVSFDIKRGEIFGLVGESGSGKSTVVQAILRILPPPAVIAGGKVLINNKNILSASNTEVLQYRWKQISIVMQSALNALNPVLTVREQIEDVLKEHNNLRGNAAADRTIELLSLIDIDASRLDSYPHQLSGGMRQRVVIAIALALMPPLIIMDEPTTALDVIVEREILAKIIELRKELGFTILFITHDLNLLLEFADRVAIMKTGKLLELDKAQKIRRGGKHEYTQKLIRSLPSAAGTREKGLLSKPESLDLGEQPLLEVRNLSKSFSDSGIFYSSSSEVVNNVSFQVFPGEIIGLVGESGSGKSTIAKLITRLIRPTSGDIFLNGSNKKVSEARRVPLEYRKQVQMVFQDPFSSLNSIHTVYHHLARPLLRHQLIPQQKLLDYIIEILETVGLRPGTTFAEKFPHEMSGGERQRVAIARALSLSPDLIIADEPTSMLDVSIRMEILEIFARMRIEKNLTIVFITHDLASARYLADRIIVLQRGSIVEQGIAEDLIQSPKEEYTKQLIKAASPGWLKSLSIINTKEASVNHV
jgi:ABC-type glutathione transport system ATPase component|tara:strand:- start:547 stop:2220 length:1674 start_codon:yes stop_codon:yes gene_type:complete